MSKLRAAQAHAADGDAGSRSRSTSPSVFRRIAAAFAALALGAGLALVAVAAPASAHHNTITGSAVCDPATETFDIKWTVVNSEMVKETITDSSNPSLVPVGTKFDTQETKTFVQSSVTAGRYTLKLDAKWDNGATQSSTGTVIVGGEGNECDEDDTKKVTFCHATSSETNPYVRNTVSVNAFLKAGHLAHEGDIYPAFSYTKHGDVVNVTAKGNQDLLQYKDCEKPKPKKINVPAEPKKHDECGVASDAIVQPPTAEGVVWTIGTVVDGKATATAATLPDYVFKDGDTSKTWHFTFTNEPCPPDVIVLNGNPVKVDQCGVDGDTITLPLNIPERITWSIVGDPKSGTATAVATAASGYTFEGGPTKEFPFTFTNEPCPPDVIVLNGNPVKVDQCGVDGDTITLPPTTDEITWSMVGDPKSGTATAVATAASGYTFEGGATKEFPFTFDSTPCPTEIQIPTRPEPADLCGVDDDRILPPAEVTGVEWTITPVVDGSASATAAVTPGFTFPNGQTSETWTFTFDDTACIPASLDGSVATGVCIADAPWIFFDVLLVDPDNQYTGDRAASLVLADGENTETIELGTLDENGALEGQTLWPGASVAADGVTPTGWPGWAFENGEWVETDGNFAWTRDVTTATLIVNPELEVAITYPPATPECDAAPPQNDTPGGNGSAPTASGLADTGFAGTTIGIVAGIIVLAGAAFLVIARIRRKRA